MSVISYFTKFYELTAFWDIATCILLKVDRENLKSHVV
jgi:hypothetical protein